ncbi:MAG: helix-turn-helix domain-containing protein [Pseudomonadota bacterium]
MISDYLTVDRAAKLLGISTRRVRTLLAQRRLAGFKDNNQVWRLFSLSIKPGKRGPKMKHKQPPKASGMAERSAAIKTAGERSEGCGKGDARDKAQTPSPDPCRRVSAEVEDKALPVSKNYAKKEGILFRETFIYDAK